MLRAFIFSNIPVRNVTNTQSDLIFLHSSNIKCSLCKSLLGRRITGVYNTSIKNRSTNVSRLHFDKLPKKKRVKRKLYTELLEVSEDNASERRAKVKTINANNISKFQEEMLTTTSDIQTFLPEQSNNESNEKLNEVVADDLTTEEVEEIIEEINDNHLESALQQNVQTKNVVSNAAKVKSSTKPLVKQSIRQALSKVKFSELDKAGKERSLTNVLTAYIDVCIASGFLNRALATLNFYLNNSNVNINDVKVFDALLSGYAQFGNVDKLIELWQLMNNRKILPSKLSYIYRIECIARSTKRNKDELLNTTLRIMFNEGISINCLFTDTKWKGDSRDVVLEAIRAVRPNFFPSVPKPDQNYCNSLVNHLNKEKNSSVIKPAEGLINIEELKMFFNKQLNREKELYVRIRSVEEPKQIDVSDYRDKLNMLQADWEKTILNAFQRDLATLNKLHNNVRRFSCQLNIYPYLTVLDKNEYKDVIMNEIQKLTEGSESYSPSMSQLYREAGQQIKVRYENNLKFKDGLISKLKGVYFEYGKWYLGPKTDHCINSRQKWKLIAHRYQKGPSLDYEYMFWPSHVLVAIGKFLYNIIMKDIKIDVNIMKKNSQKKYLLPAFYSIQKYQNQIIKEEVKSHPIVVRLLRAACLPYLTFNVAEVPMIIPPVPWTSLSTGGYVITKTNLIRLPNQAITQKERLTNLPLPQIYPCLDSLNQLGSIPWKVNKPILDLVIQIFNNGGNSKLAIPEPPSAVPTTEFETVPDAKEEKYHAYKRRLAIRRRKAEMYSLWCDALYKLSLANHFRDDIFWLPHNMDFRGRVYPCPPHLNHLSSDMSRSLLRFAKGEPLGPEGLNWLKLHLVNLTGLKKTNSVAERLEYGNSIISLIIDSAEKPLNGKKWWMESEEPWQTLAACMEIRNALQCPEGPENYICHFPVHQDGSCNGLQHYAALGRDAAGAFSVNLSPSEKPQDVYSSVASIVERERVKDAKEGVLIAQILEGFVKRKVIKQTVMTTVYGVTRFGARLQIAKQLKDIDNFPKEHIWHASNYLVGKTFISLREMFSSAREIQDWLTESARQISYLCGQNVEYLTPLGLPVVQPYTRTPKVNNPTGISQTTINPHFGMDMFEKPNTMKQRNAFPPNFIHSLDSTHMMLTSIHCEQAGITFVSVHDCFWTHPSTVNVMNKICREQFVSLHSQPILKNLSYSLLNRFGYDLDGDNDNPEIKAAKKNLNQLLKKIPSTGDFNLKDVLESVYFFS